MSEEINPEELPHLLKERTKELKLAAKRLQKLEERYVAKHREHSDILSDRTILLIFTHLMFPEQEFVYSYGGVTLDRLEMLWTAKEEEHRLALQNMNQSFNEEISKLKSKLSGQQEELKTKDLELKELYALQGELNEQQAVNVKIRGNLEFADKQLDDLRIENARLKSQQSEFAMHRANSLLATFDSKPDAEENTQLQTQLAEAQLTIQELNALIRGYEEGVTPPRRDIEAPRSPLYEVEIERQAYEARLAEMEKTLSSAQQEFMEHRRRAQKLMMEKDLQIDKLRGKLKQASLYSEDSFQRSRVETEPEESHLSMEYIKNIVLKFMEYSYAGYAREAMTLASVISTVLGFTSEEVELVRLAREGSGVINSMTGLFAVKSPGSGVSYNTLHTNEGRRRANLPPLDSLLSPSLIEDHAALNPHSIRTPSDVHLPHLDKPS
jgi:hypothetical protein